MKKIIIKLSIISLVTLPFITFAQVKDLRWLIGLTISYFNDAVFLIMGLAVVMFIWNVYKYFIKGGDDVGAKKEAGLYVMWSIIGFFVILSLWGIVNIFTTTLKLNSNAPASFFGGFQSSSSGNSIFNNPTQGGSNNGSVQGGSTNLLNQNGAPTL